MVKQGAVDDDDTSSWGCRVLCACSGLQSPAQGCDPGADQLAGPFGEQLNFLMFLFAKCNPVHRCREGQGYRLVRSASSDLTYDKYQFFVSADAQ